MTLTEELNSVDTSNTNRREASNALQSDWAAIRVSFDGWPGTGQSVKRDKQDEMAHAVGAEKLKSASVPKFNDKHPAYKALKSVKGKIKDLWELRTLDWVEDGVRLIRQDRIDQFNRDMDPLRAELDAAREEFRAVYDSLVEEARIANGPLFDGTKYLATFDGAYTFTVDYPSLTVPSYLKGLNPKLYEEACARVNARFDAAVASFEEEAFGTLAKLTEDLQRKLAGIDDGTEKRLHDSTLTNLREFFDRFKSLNIHSSAELDRVVAQAEEALSGKSLIGGKPLTRDELRDSESLRRDVRTRLAAVTASIEGAMVAAPRRAINRRKAPETAPQE